MLRNQRRLKLELLDDRLVPSATVLDLTTHEATATAPSGAIVTQIDPQPTGTGYIRSFVRVQGPAKGGSEQGYNTDARPLQFDENNSPQFTRSITLDKVPLVTLGGVQYREFLLDINQKASSPYLSLDEVRIFLGDTGNLTGYSTSMKTLAGMNSVFDLDTGGDVSVKLNANLSTGSGSGDMSLLVPNADFAGATSNSFVYLYSKFGTLYGANGGFEEWSVKSAPPVQVPPPVGSLSGAVFIDGNNNGVMDAGEGISGVPIQLQGTDSAGNTVVLTTTTDSNGMYTFGNLAAGTYTIIQEPTSAYSETSEMVGTTGGIADTDNNQFTTITLAAGQSGTGYYFEDIEKE